MRRMCIISWTHSLVSQSAFSPFHAHECSIRWKAITPPHLPTHPHSHTDIHAYRLYIQTHTYTVTYVCLTMSNKQQNLIISEQACFVDICSWSTMTDGLVTWETFTVTGSQSGEIMVINATILTTITVIPARLQMCVECTHTFFSSSLDDDDFRTLERSWEWLSLCKFVLPGVT